MAVLILGGTDDEHAVRVLDYLLARKADAALLDSRWFPKDLGVSFDPAADRWTITLPGGRALDGGEVSAIYWRCYNGVETPRARVTLATGIPESVCREINLGYRDWRTLRPEDFAGREHEGVLLVPKAGEQLYKLRR